MRKFLLAVLGFFVFIVTVNNLFKLYKEHNLLSTEAVINFYFKIPDEHIDSFFNLPKGTYNKNEHAIVCSFQKSSTYGHGAFHNFPIKIDVNTIDCKESFSIEKHKRFNISNIQDYNNLYIRLINIKNPSILSSEYSSSIAFRKKEIVFKLGKINNFIIDFNTVDNYCQ